MVDFRDMPSAKISVAVAKVAHSDAYVDVVLSGTPDGHHRLLEPFAAFLDSADYVIAHNGHVFDLRVLQNYFPPERVAVWKAKLIDLKAKFMNVAQRVPQALASAQRTGGRTRTSLNDMLVANSMMPKTGDGRKAVNDWRAGRHADVLEHCRSDVDLLCGLWEKRHVRMMRKDGTLHPNVFDLHAYMALDSSPRKRARLDATPEGDREYIELYGESPEADGWEDLDSLEGDFAPLCGANMSV